MTVDDVWCAIGSSNFDDRSFETNDEITLGFTDPASPSVSIRSSRGMRRAHGDQARRVAPPRARASLEGQFRLPDQRSAVRRCDRIARRRHNRRARARRHVKVWQSLSRCIGCAMRAVGAARERDGTRGGGRDARVCSQRYSTASYFGKSRARRRAVRVFVRWLAGVLRRARHHRSTQFGMGGEHASGSEYGPARTRHLRGQAARMNSGGDTRCA